MRTPSYFHSASFLPLPPFFPSSHFFLRLCVLHQISIQLNSFLSKCVFKWYKKRNSFISILRSHFNAMKNIVCKRRSWFVWPKNRVHNVCRSRYIRFDHTFFFIGVYISETEIKKQREKKTASLFDPMMIWARDAFNGHFDAGILWCRFDGKRFFVFSIWWKPVKQLKNRSTATLLWNII